jgi:type IV pilus assembly protein PilB
MARQRLGEILVAAGVLRPEQVESALAHQQRWGGPLGQILVGKNYLSEDALVVALSRQLSIPIADLKGARIPKDVVGLVPYELASDHHVLPFRREGRFLDLAMDNPLNLGITDELRIRTKLNIRPFIAGTSAIQNALRLNYGTSLPLEMMGAAARRGGERRSIEVRDPAISAAEFTRLQERVQRLEGVVSRNEDIIRKLMRLLIDKSVTSREEILSAIR